MECLRQGIIEDKILNQAYPRSDQIRLSFSYETNIVEESKWKNSGVVFFLRQNRSNKKVLLQFRYHVVKYARWKQCPRCLSGGVRHSVQAVITGLPAESWQRAPRTARWMKDSLWRSSSAVPLQRSGLLHPPRWWGEDCHTWDTGAWWVLGNTNNSLWGRGKKKTPTNKTNIN